MIECGVPEKYYDGKAEGSKGQFIPVIINELAERGDEGKKVLDTVCIELAALDGAIDKNELDNASAERSLAALRRQMSKAGVSGKRPLQADPDQEEKEKQSKQLELSKLLAAVRDRFYELHKGEGTPQERGIEFQKLLKELFSAHGIPYDAPFRVPAQEMDGQFAYSGKHFLVEARWRKEDAAFQALSVFDAKVKTKLRGTLGLFISMQGFQPDAVQSLLHLGDRCLLLLPGIEFVKIIEEHISLPDALDLMIGEAHKRGTILVALPI